MRNAAKDEIEMTARRESMLKEGFRLFSEKGIEEVSMQEVAGACGVGSSTMNGGLITGSNVGVSVSNKKYDDDTYGVGTFTMNGGEIYCVVTEKYCNRVTTGTVTVTISE